MATFEGSLTNAQGQFAIVVSRFNQLVTEQLLNGAQDGFRRFGVSRDQVDVAWVPGSFEIPLAAKKLAESNRYQAILCLGAVIKGDTDHYDYVAGGAANGIAQASIQTGVPVIFGILTCNTLEQALHRAGGKAGNKGYEAALTAIEMADLLKKLT